MIQKEKLASLIEKYLADNLLFLVDITISPDNDIEITIESLDSDVNLDNCTDINRIIIDSVDRDIEDYSLTVTSAGLDQPFKVLLQYRKYLGKEVTVLKKDGSKITGILREASEENIDLEYTKMVAVEGKKRKEKRETRERLPLSDIKSTKPFINFR
ncbi:MAG: ribosome assembly cofactor RimP [Bacteroidales bacterium]|nr:ribosome assembly cofactor RimP [Bacteroidales bacterium]